MRRSECGSCGCSSPHHRRDSPWTGKRKTANFVRMRRSNKYPRGSGTRAEREREREMQVSRSGAKRTQMVFLKKGAGTNLLYPKEARTHLTVPSLRIPSFEYLLLVSIVPLSRVLTKVHDLFSLFLVPPEEERSRSLASSSGCGPDRAFHPRPFCRSVEWRGTRMEYRIAEWERGLAKGGRMASVEIACCHVTADTSATTIFPANRRTTTHLRRNHFLPLLLLLSLFLSFFLSSFFSPRVCVVSALYTSSS